VSTPRKTVAKSGAGAGTTPSARKTTKPTATDSAATDPTATDPAATEAGKVKGGRAVPPPGPGLVVGTVPALARVAGVVAVVAAVVLLVAPAFPLARSGGADLGGPGNAFAFLPPLPLVLAVAAAGVLAARGRLPRLGLALLFPAGTVAAGLLLQTASLLRTGSHSTVDLPLGIGTSARYEVGPGLVLSAVGYGVLVVAALLAAAAWPRTIMEDTGDLDPRRPRLAAWGLAAGVLTALVLGMAPYSSSIAPGAPTLPERHGLDLLGAAVVALGAAAWAVLAATLRPRLAVVGAYAGLAATLLTIGLAVWLLVARSPAIGASAGGVGVLLAALATAVLGLVTARVGRPVRPKGKA
jgi:iron complex transport system permease protein